MLQDTLVAYPVVTVAGTCILGLLIGSFLNVVIHRLPKLMQAQWQRDCCELLEQPAPEQKAPYNLVFPASHCPKCDHAIKPWENIPLISWLFLRGKCSSCSTPISKRYPLVELATGLLSGYAAYAFGFGWPLALVLVLTWSLVALTMIDADTQLLPDSITLPLMWIGLIANYFGLFTSFEEAFWGAIAGYLSLWSVFWLFKLVTGKEGMGYGDFKLLAALGAFMGWQALPLIIILSSLVGAIIGIAGILIHGRDKNIPIPFGPYLAIAGWIALMWGDQITQAYLQFSNLSH